MGKSQKTENWCGNCIFLNLGIKKIRKKKGPIFLRLPLLTNRIISNTQIPVIRKKFNAHDLSKANALNEMRHDNPTNNIPKALFIKMTLSGDVRVE